MHIDSLYRKSYPLYLMSGEVKFTKLFDNTGNFKRSQQIKKSSIVFHNHLPHDDHCHVFDAERALDTCAVLAGTFVFVTRQRCISVMPGFHMVYGPVFTVSQLA